MASIVQAKYGNTTGSGLNLTFDSDVTAGNIVIAFARISPTNTFGSVTGGSLTWNNRGVAQTSSGTNNHRSGLWDATVAVTGALTVTINANTGTTFHGGIFELEGLEASPFDSIIGSVSAGPVDSLAIGNLSPAAPNNNLLFTCVSAGTDEVAGFTAPSGYTKHSQALRIAAAVKEVLATAGPHGGQTWAGDGTANMTTFHTAYKTPGGSSFQPAWANNPNQVA